MTQTYKVQVSMNQAHIVESGFVWKQGDFGFNIEIEVLDFDTTGATPQIIFRKSTGAVEATQISVAGNKFTYAIRGTELDTPGPCVCDLKLNDSTTKRVSTASFKYFVIPDTMDGLEQEASSYSDTIAQLLANTLQKSETAGLVKNDGTIDTNNYEGLNKAFTYHAKIKPFKVVNGFYNNGTLNDARFYATIFYDVTKIDKILFTGISPNNTTYASLFADDVFIKQFSVTTGGDVSRVDSEIGIQAHRDSSGHQDINVIAFSIYSKEIFNTILKTPIGEASNKGIYDPFEGNGMDAWYDCEPIAIEKGYYSSGTFQPSTSNTTYSYDLKDIECIYLNFTEAANTQIVCFSQSGIAKTHSVTSNTAREYCIVNDGYIKISFTSNASKPVVKIRKNIDNFSINTAEEYSANKTYNVGEFVLYNGSFYKCKTAITTSESWTSGHWEKTSISTELNSLGYITEVHPYKIENGYYNNGVFNEHRVYATLFYDISTFENAFLTGINPVNTTMFSVFAGNEFIQQASVASGSDRELSNVLVGIKQIKNQTGRNDINILAVTAYSKNMLDTILKAPMGKASNKSNFAPYDNKGYEKWYDLSPESILNGFYNQSGEFIPSTSNTTYVYNFLDIACIKFNFTEVANTQIICFDDNGAAKSWNILSNTAREYCIINNGFTRVAVTSNVSTPNAKTRKSVSDGTSKFMYSIAEGFELKPYYEEFGLYQSGSTTETHNGTHWKKLYYDVHGINSCTIQGLFSAYTTPYVGLSGDLQIITASENYTTESKTYSNIDISKIETLIVTVNIANYATIKVSTTEACENSKVYADEAKNYTGLLKKTGITSIAKKRIWWCGTSIPAGYGTNFFSYPIQVGQLLDCEVYNVAVGSSSICVKDPSFITEDNPRGFFNGENVPWDGVHKGMTNTWDDIDWLCGSDNHLVMSGKPESFTPQEIQYFKDNYSYQGNLDPYLSTGNKGPCDIYVFDHGRNDVAMRWYAGLPYTNCLVEPDNPTDTRYFQGAVRFLVERILNDNPHAKIVFVSHFTDDDKNERVAGTITVQEQTAKNLHQPFIELYKYSPINCTPITVNGVQTTVFDIYCPDGVHPFSDTTGYSNAMLAQLHAKLLSSFLY